MSTEQKIKTAKIILKVILYVGAIVSVFLVLESVASNHVLTVTVNWVQCLIGIILFIVSAKLYDWAFCKRSNKDE